MADSSIEERLSALEAEVRWLKQQQARERGTVSGKTTPDFLERFSGIFADDPTFETMVQRIEKRRQKEREQAEQEANKDAM